MIAISIHPYLTAQTLVRTPRTPLPAPLPLSSCMRPYCFSAVLPLSSYYFILKVVVGHCPYRPYSLGRVGGI